MNIDKIIYCCGCQTNIKARLTDGAEVYSHRKDLKNLPFWICDNCNNFVGCQYKTRDRTKPLGVIATKEIKKYRIKIHSIIDPLWKKKLISRDAIYKRISKEIGTDYHTANLRSIDECENVLDVCYDIYDEFY